MATKLDDLKFNDYTLKGISNSGGGKDFSLGANDTIGVEGYGTILSYSSESGGWFLDGYARYATDGIPGVLEKDGCGNWTFNGESSTCRSIPDALYEGGCGQYELHVSYAYINAISISGRPYTLSVDNGFVKATEVITP